MAEKRTPRPVFGEIMAMSAPAAGSGGFVAVDALDADYESMPRSRPDCASPQLSAAPKLHGMNMLSRDKIDSIPRRAQRGGAMFWGTGLGLALVAFWIAGGHALIRPFLFADGEQAANALNLSAVTSRVDISGDKPVLFVDGEAGNDGGAAASLPPIAISVKDNHGATIRYTLGTDGRTLEPGERFAFSSRLAAPTNGVKSVSVTFAE